MDEFVAAIILSGCIQEQEALAQKMAFALASNPIIDEGDGVRQRYQTRIFNSFLEAISVYDVMIDRITIDYPDICGDIDLPFHNTTEVMGMHLSNNNPAIPLLRQIEKENEFAQ
jgi:hypothetical protein